MSFASSATSPHALGLHKHPKGVKSVPDSSLNLAGLFRTGSGVLRYSGMLDRRPLAIYQHQYMIFAGTTTVPVIHSIYLVEVSPHWPMVNITKRSPWNWVGRLLGRSSGLLLDDAQFNNRFKVTTDDDDFTIALLSPELQQFLLTKTGVTWRIDLGRLALLYSGKLKDKKISTSLERVRGFLERIPDELNAWQ